MRTLVDYACVQGGLSGKDRAAVTLCIVRTLRRYLYRGMARLFRGMCQPYILLADLQEGTVLADIWVERAHGNVVYFFQYQ